MNPRNRLTALSVFVLACVASIPAAAQSLDYDTFKTQVEPIFVKKRPTHARCVVCHAASNNAFRLQPLDKGAAFWTEEQSRKNFASTTAAPLDASRISTAPTTRSPFTICGSSGSAARSTTGPSMRFSTGCW